MKHKAFVMYDIIQAQTKIVVQNSSGREKITPWYGNGIKKRQPSSATKKFDKRWLTDRQSRS
jgi:hypothetical protein